MVGRARHARKDPGLASPWYIVVWQAEPGLLGRVPAGGQNSVTCNSVAAAKYVVGEAI